jgi:hypothetical protein
MEVVLRNALIATEHWFLRSKDQKQGERGLACILLMDLSLVTLRRRM